MRCSCRERTRSEGLVRGEEVWWVYSPALVAAGSIWWACRGGLPCTNFE